MPEACGKIRVRDMQQPPGLEDWQWAIIVENHGDLVLAEPSNRTLVVREWCEQLGDYRETTVILLKKNAAAVSLIRGEVQKQLGIAKVEEPQEDRDPWEQDPDAWKA